MQNKGFTLIELLVVIAIIGILAGIIVVSMGTAQKQANDAKIEATMNQMRTAGQIYYINNGNKYIAGTTFTSASATDCATGLTGTVGVDTNFAALCTSVDGVTAVKVVVGEDGGGWCSSAQLMNDTSKYWCVDSSGNSKQYSADPATCATNTATPTVPPKCQ